jgi:hypothetical protein
MFDAFFSDGHQYDFAEKVITPFFVNSGDKIFKNLVVAEVLGASSAKAILDRELTDVRRSVKEMNNAQRGAILNWLKKFAFLRSEDSLLILRSILESPAREDFYKTPAKSLLTRTESVCMIFLIRV